MENDFNSLEKEIIKSLKKEIHSRDDVERGLAYYTMLFEPVLLSAEKAVKQYTKVMKEAASDGDLTEDMIAYQVIGLLQDALVDRIIKGPKNG